MACAASGIRAFPTPNGQDGLVRPLGGLILNDPALGPGGLSGLHLDASLRLTAVGDTGTWTTARLVLTDNRLTELDDIRTGRLRDAGGRPLTRTERDAECLARLPDGTWLVGFERRHRVVAYRDLDGPCLPVTTPPGLDQSPGNGGLESLAVLADGRCLAIAEQLAPADTNGLRTAWFGHPAPAGVSLAWTSLAYRPEDGMDPTDAAGLPNGDALVVERRFSLFGGFAARLARIPAATLRAPPGGVLSGPTLLRLAHPWPEENWEGIAVTVHGGRTLVALVADDNQNAWQRQLLLLLELRGG